MRRRDRRGTAYNAADLRSDPRWPDFGARAAEVGVLSMLSFRLFIESNPDVIAGLNLYASKPSAFDEQSESIGTLFATHGALAIAGAAPRRRPTTWPSRCATAARSGSPWEC